ncbi:hypothetical protein AAVH_21123 [Aphelenchoides avenae]|nr:hypothetical protein AAVH_21123 [Aphelenchus avenae]
MEYVMARTLKPFRAVFVEDGTERRFSTDRKKCEAEEQKQQLVSNYKFSRAQKQIEITSTNEEIWHEQHHRNGNVRSRTRKALLGF